VKRRAVYFHPEYRAGLLSAVVAVALWPKSAASAGIGSGRLLLLPPMHVHCRERRWCACSSSTARLRGSPPSV
jgi:hypothetical protein